MLSDELPEAGQAPLIRIEELGGERTRLVLSSLAQGHDYICLSVSDSGTGMNQIVMQHIFEPFFTTKPVDEGTGLGLAMVHGVVTGHQGAMVIDSTLGEGTEFKLFFLKAEDISAFSEVSDADAGQNESWRILLVEDQEEVRDMMMNMLQRMGYKASCCFTGLEALDVLRENPDAFDLVLTDQNMPGMTGYEFICEAYPDFENLPFIILSGYSQQKLKGMIKEHPAIRAVLKKPVSRKILGQQISAVMARQKAA